MGAGVLLVGLVLAASVLARGEGHETGFAEDRGDVVPEADERGSAGGHDHNGDHGTSATAEELGAAEKLVGDTEADAVRFEDFEVARAEGYEPLGGERGGGPRHFVNKRYFADGRVLDPERPESLVYTRTREGGTALIGVMYVAPRGKGPTDGGAQWHTHDDLCVGLDEAGAASISPKTGGCPGGSLPVSELEMMHVWLFDHPDGPLAHDLEPEDALVELL